MQPSIPVNSKSFTVEFFYMARAGNASNVDVSASFNCKRVTLTNCNYTGIPATCYAWQETKLQRGSLGFKDRIWLALSALCRPLIPISRLRRAEWRFANSFFFIYHKTCSWNRSPTLSRRSQDLFLRPNKIERFFWRDFSGEIFLEQQYCPYNFVPIN